MQVEATMSSRASRPVSRAPAYVCTCLRVTECELLAALSRPDVRTLQDVRCAIGAGDGCTACHDLLRQYLDARGQPSCPPICSAR